MIMIIRFRRHRRRSVARAARRGRRAGGDGWGLDPRAGSRAARLPARGGAGAQRRGGHSLVPSQAGRRPGFRVSQGQQPGVTHSRVPMVKVAARPGPLRGYSVFILHKMDKLNSFLSKPIADILKGSAGEGAGNTVPEPAVVSALALYKVFLDFSWF